MPRRKFIEKKNATTFSLVHRPQTDPLIHDPSAPDRILTEVDTSQPKARNRKVKQRGDLEAEFGLSTRDNEGEAANYGIFYDDSEYDYMQHLRDLGSGTDAYFVDAQQAQTRQKGKGKQKLEDALREVDLNDERDNDLESEGGISVAGSLSQDPAHVKNRTLEAQQDIPDSIAGFKPDMDPRLREALEALENEAYVDDEDDLFAELAKDGEEVDPLEWQRAGWVDEEDLPAGDEEDEGWETDDTAKPRKEYKNLRPGSLAPADEPPSTDSTATAAGPSPDAEAADSTNGAWLHEFSKFKKAVKSSSATHQGPPQPGFPSAIAPPSILTGLTSLTDGGRRKKRKGALTSSTGYSMTSSSLQRTGQQTLLDRRFEKIEELYAPNNDDAFADADDDDASISGLSALSGISRASNVSRVSNLSGASKSSQAPSLVSATEGGALRSDFDDIMDDFLDGYGVKGKPGRQRVKRGAGGSGMMQLDEIRRGLGPARIDGRA